MGAVVTGLTLGAPGIGPNDPSVQNKTKLLSKEGYPLVMDTKLKIIEILQVSKARSEEKVLCFYFWFIIFTTLTTDYSNGETTKFPWSNECVL